MTPLKKTTLFILVVTGTCIAGIGLILYLRSLETAAPDSTADQAEKKSDTSKQTNNSVAAPDASADAVTETGQEPNNARAAIAATVVVILMAFVLLVIIKIKTRRRKAMWGQEASQPKPSIQPEAAPAAPEVNPLQPDSQEASSIQPKTTAPPEPPATTDASKRELWRLAVSKAKAELQAPSNVIVKAPRNLKAAQKALISTNPDDIGVRVYVRANEILTEQLKDAAETKKEVKFLNGDVEWQTKVLENKVIWTEEEADKILKQVLNPVRVETIEGLKQDAKVISSDGEELMGYYDWRMIDDDQAKIEDQEEEKLDPDSKKSYLNEITMGSRLA